jgi:VWFA-related protein
MADYADTTQERTPALGISAGALCILGLVLAGGVAKAQQATLNKGYTIAVDVNRVVLDVTVTDRKGRWIPGLTQDRFRLLEDGVEQKILDVTQEDRPLTLGLVVDSSRSIGERRAEVITGVMRLGVLSHEEDDLFLVSFNDAPHFGLDGPGSYTRSLPTLRNALFKMTPEGRTALYDAVILTLDQLAAGKWEREAAVIFSDGGDTASHASLEEAIERVQRSNALVYAVGLASDINPYRSPKTLKKLARASGGEAFFPTHDDELKNVCESIAKEMRSQYTLTYAPANTSREGRYREISVEIAGGGKWEVRAREGYFEPNDGGEPRR